MKDNVFIDTNVLVYAYLENIGEKTEKALGVLDNEFAFISTQVLQEFCNTSSKKFKRSFAEVSSAVAELVSNFYVYTNTEATIKGALIVAEKYGFSFYDSVIVSASLESGCKILYTEDLQHGQVIEDRLRIINPFKDELS